MSINHKSRILILLVVGVVGLSGCLTQGLPGKDKPDGPAAEVVRTGDLWTTTIAGELIYQGTELSDAITAAIENLGPGTINIRSSGELRKTIYPRTGQTLDFHNHPIGGDQGIHVYHQDYVTIRNLHMIGTPLHSLRINGSSHIHLHNIRLQFNGNSNGIRIDNDLYANKVYTTDIKVTGEVFIEGTRGDGLETYGIDGLYIEKIVTRNTAGCGLMLNETKNAYVGLVDAYRASVNDGYAGFRVANHSGPNIVVDRVIAKQCGRGVFILSGSHGVEINYVDIDGSYKQEAILIQGAWDVTINGGVVRGYQKYGIRLIEGSHTNGKVSNVTIQNVRVYDTRKNSQAVGIIEERGASNNRFLNNDLRNAGGNRSRDLILRSGSGSIAIGNILTGD